MFNENTWKEGELKTQKYMESQGYKIVYTNFRCNGAELDIVAILPTKIQLKNLKSEFKQKLKLESDKNLKKMLKQNFKNLKSQIKDILIITEVKARSSERFGKGIESVDSLKMYHMNLGADYLLSKPEFNDMQVRFDLASVDCGKLTYIENAFWQNKK